MIMIIIIILIIITLIIMAIIIIMKMVWIVKLMNNKHDCFKLSITEISVAKKQ